MSFRHKYDPLLKSYIPHLTEASTAGNIQTTDIGRLVGNTTGGDLQGVSLLRGTTNTALQIIKGILVAMPSGATGSTAGSTSATVWVQPILPGEIIEADYSTTVNVSGGANVIGCTASDCTSRPARLGETPAVFVGKYIGRLLLHSAGDNNGCFFEARILNRSHACWEYFCTFLSY